MIIIHAKSIEQHGRSVSAVFYELINEQFKRASEDSAVFKEII